MDKIEKRMNAIDAIVLACKKTQYPVSDVVDVNYISNNNIAYQKHCKGRGVSGIEIIDSPHWTITFMTHDEFRPNDTDAFNSYSMQNNVYFGHVIVYENGHVAVQGKSI
jgi:hypothetical protein